MKLERLLGYRDEPRTRRRSARPRLQLRPDAPRRPRRRRGLAPRRPPPAAARRSRPASRCPAAASSAPSALMRDYTFAEGSAVRAIFEEDAPLEGRDMLLIGRFARPRLPPRRPRHRRGRRAARGRRPAGARLGLELPHPPGPPRARPDELRGVEVARHRRASSSASPPSRTARASATRSSASGSGLLGRREQVKFYRHTCEVMARRTTAGVAAPGRLNILAA